MSARRTVTFARDLPGAVRLCGGILNPLLWHAIRATWLRTGPPAPPIDLTDEEWDSFLDCVLDARPAPAEDGDSHQKGVGPSDASS